jgi:hypothetical protein
MGCGRPAHGIDASVSIARSLALGVCRGNLFGMFGMLIAILVTVFDPAFGTHDNQPRTRSGVHAAGGVRLRPDARSADHEHSDVVRTYRLGFTSI